MAKNALNEYSKTAASNTDVGGVDLGEGTMAVSDINDAMREIMSHLAEFNDGTEGIDVLSLQDDDGSAAIKIQAPSAVTTTTTFTLPDGDGSDGQVLQTDGSGTLSWGAGIPAGVIVPYGGTSAPTGWLLCYGQSVASATYGALYTAIGTTYGGDATNFNLPDIRGRVVAGQDDMGSTSANRLTNQSGGLDGDTLGATGGSETHTLVTAEMPAHTHNVQYRTHDTSPGSGGEESDMVRDGTSTRATTSTGGDGAHNNVQPTIILNYIIKT